MKILKNLSSREILKIYLEENNRIKGPDYKQIKRVIRKKKSGYLVNLTKKEIEEIIMVNHFLCNCNYYFNFKGMVLRKFAGLNLKQVFLKIVKDEKYPKKYLVCWERINKQKNLLEQKKRSTIFLSQGRPFFFDLSYFGADKQESKLFLVDGFHRLVALMFLKNKSNILKFVLIK